MFFILSKVLAFFTQPSNVAILIVLIGALLLFTRFARAARRLVVFGCVLMVVIGLSPLGRVLMNVLEDRFPPWDATRGAPTGFIILGGSVNPEISIARKTTALPDAAERLTVVPLLASRYPHAKFIFSGGNASIFGGPAEADYVMPLFESFGIARDRIAIENASRNTAENAELSRKLAAPKPGDRWVIITSAYHTPRSVGSFRAAGFDVEAYPVDYRTAGSSDGFEFFRSFAAGFSYVDLATREFIGMLMYRLTGRSSEFFPAPR